MTCMSTFTKASKFGLQVDKIKQLHFFWNRFKPEKAYGIQGFLLIKIEILKSRTPTSSSNKAPLSYIITMHYPYKELIPRFIRRISCVLNLMFTLYNVKLYVVYNIFRSSVNGLAIKFDAFKFDV